MVTIVRPTLTWDLDNPDAFDVNFTVYMDENQDPTTVRATGLKTLSYTVEEDLINNYTYYWNIVPSFGIAPTSPNNFTINLGYQKVYRINMTSEFNLLSLKQGQKGYSNLTVKNKGNVADTIRFDIISLKLKQYLDIEPTNLQLQSQESGDVKLTINTPPSFEEGWYKIEITAKSMGNASQTDSVNIWVEVYSKFEIRDYNVTIEVVPNSIDIKQTQSGTVKLIIENTGNQFEEYGLDYKSTEFFGTSVEISNVTVRLDPGIEISVEVTITVPATMEIGPHTITFVAKSANSLDQNDLVVNVLKRSSEPGIGIDNNGDGDTTDPGDDHDGDGLINSVDPDDDNDGILDGEDDTPFGEASSTDGNGDDNSMMIILIVIVVIIVVVMLVVMMYLRKKKEEKYLKELEEETEDERIEPGDDQPPTPPTEPPGEPAELPMAQPMPADTDPAAQPPESPSVRVESTPEPEVQQPAADGYYQEPTVEAYSQEQPTIEPQVQPEYNDAPLPTPEVAAADTPTPEVAATDTQTPEVETTDTPTTPAVAQPVVAKPVE
jgi:hypothetical protein